MKKKTAVFCLLGALALGTCTVSAENGTREIPVAFRDIKIIVDGKELSTGAEPLIYNDTTYLPIRVVGEAVGKKVEWENRTNTVALRSAPPLIEYSSEETKIPDFTLSITPSGREERTEIFRVHNEPHIFSLYYYGVSDVSVTIDGQTAPLAEALESGRISLKHILQKAWQDIRDGKISCSAPRGSGEVAYFYDGYTIVKAHRMDDKETGNRDFYIGVPEIYRKIYKFYPHEGYSSVYDVIDFHAESIKEEKHPGLKQMYFKEKLEMMQEIAKRDLLTDSELQEAIQQFRKACGIE